MNSATLHPGAITEVAGIELGHYNDPRRPTGCTVVLARAGAVAGVDVRGAAPGTRETDLLRPGNLVERVHAVLLSGGSAWGLDAAAGVMRWLEEQDIGFATSHALVPIVPAAVIYDLGVGDAHIRPDAQAGYLACAAASRQHQAQGNMGAGCGALVGKLFGQARAMKGGVGTASLSLQGITVGAMVVCNAVGDVREPSSGQVLAGARCPDGQRLLDSHQAILGGALPQHLLAGQHTTIGVIATDATLNQAQAMRLAQVAHDGLARAINPVHTQFDGDTLFALATCASKQVIDPVLLAMLAAEATARATVNAVLAARGLTLGDQHWPAATELSG